MGGLIVHHWSVGPVGWVVVAVAVLHQVGYLRRQRAARDRTSPAYRARRRRAIAFIAGLASVFLALESPVDYWADTLFWSHMIEHLLLWSAAAPLIALGAPWLLLLRGLPRRWRRPVSRFGLRSRVLVPLRGLWRLVDRPVVAWVLFTADVWAWHMPAPYDATLAWPAVHYTEHITFLALGVLFWLQIVDSHPMRSPLTKPGRIVFAAAGAVQNWVLAMALTFSTHPWYSGYADLAHRPGGITAIQDQHLGAAIMWVPGMIPLAVAILVLAHQWLNPSRVVSLDEELAELVVEEAATHRRPSRFGLSLAPRHRWR
ncbi:MAG: cytochrome c oxidase assembly protein [Acidimicrobiales bacterium]